MKKIILILGLIILIAIFYFSVLRKSDKVKQIENKITTTEIVEILNDARTYQGKTVTVHGKVTSSLNLIVKIYSINDGTGEILIRTNNAVPMEGEEMKVSGVVNQFFKIDDKQLIVIEESN